MKTCPECRQPMIDMGYREHPSCDPVDPNAARIRQLHAEAAAARDAGIAQTVEAHPDAMTVALRVIDQASRQFETISANTTREAMRAAEVPGPIIGAAFREAVKQGLIKPVGRVASTQRETHAHEVRTYRRAA